MAENEQDIYIIENDNGIEIKETVDVIEVSDATLITVDSLEAFPALGEGNQNLRHSLLNERELYDQHPITAITGLREELDDIESLGVIYSNEKNYANYYMWQDENPSQENREGFFVTICSDINQIRICTLDDDVFGVTVGAAAFIGGQDDVIRDSKYGLVATSGIVHVMCELDVDVGDYVISNNYGIAQKTNNDCGCKVIAISNINGILHATIALGSYLNQIHTLAGNTKELDSRISVTERNVISAINVANEAYNKSGESNNISEEAIKNALEALNKSNEVIEKTNDIETIVSSANETAVQAKAIAESAAVTAESMKTEAINTANDAFSEISNLTKTLEPITTWVDPEGSGHTGASYLAEYMTEGLATKAQIEIVETKTEEALSSISQNGKSIEMLVASIDKYSVGEYSQAYGLTREQAKNILKEGMVYIPTKHSDTRSHSETFSDDGETNEFTPGTYYVWDGNDWIESQPNSVAFFSEEPFPSEALQYWYVDSNTAPNGYEPQALYINNDGQWEKVNTLAGNVMNRVTSMIRQTANEVAIEVTNMGGSVASLSERVTASEAYIGQVASIKNPDGSVNATASIVAAVNGSGSSVTVTADNIVLDGSVIAPKTIQTGSIIAENLSSISANLGEITAGTLTSVNYTANEQGLKIDLNNAVFDSKYFKLTSDGSATIAGWNITDKSLVNTNCLLSVGDDIERTFAEETYSDWVIGAGDKFGVRKDGTLYCTNANISGTVTATAGTIGGCAINSSGNLQVSDINIAGTIAGSKIEGSTLKIAKGATIAGWNIDSNSIYKHDGTYGQGTFMCTGTSNSYSIGGSDSISGWVFGAGGKFGVTKEGAVYADDVHLTGKITATSGSIGLWKVDNEDLIDPGALIGQYVPDISIVNQYIIMTGTSVTHRTIMGPTTQNVEGYWPDIIDAGNNTVSDFRLKNSIEELSEQYDTFFDMLVPKRYKYNQGTSDRYHTGFIAQEVVNSLTKAGLDTQQFAAVCLDNAGLEKERWRLRRDEFVALNTWQIQKAKKRITELENKVAELEALIKE